MSDSSSAINTSKNADSEAQKTTSTDAKPRTIKGPLSPATRDEIDLIHPRLMEAIETSPYYDRTFKDFEKTRLTKQLLIRLSRVDPMHVAAIKHKGALIGFMLSGPELGTIWLYWSYVFPEARKAGLALASLRQFIEHWDFGRFHKIATYTKPDNKVGLALLHRYGFELACKLENHIFGEDYLLYEHPLQKTVPGYDRGVPAQGRLGRFKEMVAGLFGAN